METRLIDGKEIARQIRAELKEKIRKTTGEGSRAPGLTVILVGEDPASEIYVSSKAKACGWIGIRSRTLRFPADVSQEELEQTIDALNRDEAVDGILLQLPIPQGLDEKALLNRIDPSKDVDGFHPVNVGKMAIGDPDALVSCTPLGVLEMLKRSGIDIESKRCVVAGRSNIVGKPMARLLLAENGTVTLCHSRTKDMASILKQAEIFVSAIGRPKYFHGDQFSEGVVIVDVGIHRLEDGICGDVDFDSCQGIASAITPVPGGVGPMTIAMLLYNTCRAWEAHLQGQH